MSDRSSGVDWVETTEEVVIAEECLSPGDNSSAVIPVLESTKTPIQRLLDTVGHGDSPDSEDGFYCEECLTLFQDQSDPANISGPSFILDFPTSLGVPQRALLSLPHGLMIGRSSIPSAGIGVINHGPVVSPGMHFGPYEGEVTTREDALESHFSWEIYKGKDEYEYIDAARESCSNWMRYINSARSKDETNLLAVQYKGSILFHCCRTINPGDELMVWPSSKLLSRFSDPWGQAWLMKVNSTESSAAATGQIFLCSQCQLTFTTEAFLQSHVQHFHMQPEEGDATADEPENPATGADSASSLLVVSVDGDKSNTCGDCGKIFKQIPHLRRHQLCVHSNKRPYCCPQCRRTFSQASGLIRHQLVHKKPADAGADPDQNLGEENEDESQKSELAEADETMPEDVDEAEETSAAEAEPSLSICADCGKSFTNEASLKKHRVTVHERLRPYVCTVCQKCFGQYSDLTRHLRRHQRQGKSAESGEEAAGEEGGSLPFSCGQCALEFPSVDSLQQHIDQCHKDQGQEEELVLEDQSQDPDFIPQASEAESTQKRPSLRPQRPAALSKISALTRLIAPKRKAPVAVDTVVDEPATGPSQHQGSDSDPDEEASDATNSKLVKYKWFSCNHCKQMYGDPEELRTHKCALRQHKCGQCGATFSKSGFLKRHEQMAHGEPKDYSCERCGKVFSTSGNMRQHERSNTCLKYHCNSELFSCSYCQFSFTMRSYLIKHVKRHHPDEYLSQCDSEGAGGGEAPEADEAGEREFVCPQCGKTCPSQRALKLHSCFQQVNVLYLCTDCGKGFTNHYSLKQHQRVHTGEKPYSCPHCGKSFSYTGQLNVHLRTHTGEKPYLCTHCGESFRQSGDLKRHERKHTGVRPYSCPECCKSFSRPQSLKAHQMLHQGEKMFKCTQCGKSFSRNYHLRRHHQKMHM